jgi:hypothetical protein
VVGQATFGVEASDAFEERGVTVVAVAAGQPVAVPGVRGGVADRGDAVADQHPREPYEQSQRDDDGNGAVG